ncbi:hypothetical protein GCM10010330_56820 [Streptomyces tendae]|uniref:hypothetical protein n=1 Tax=Streptomyces tendae TaxID=1932 RepID=UPI0019A79F44|nr:hypothetical protein [Streptomyces tendae]GHA95305.1 hypothetical protein GCM10010330_56820 [Streptomyces tendae]
MTESRRFHLQRTHDVTGVSGTGRVANGVLWPDGTVSIRWAGDRPSTVFWDDVAHAEAVHGHGGHTAIVWDDPDPDPAPAGDCEHCPDGHTPADSGSQPWHVRVGPERDGDGQPIRLYVERSAGAHVADADAEWIRARLNGGKP